MVKENLKNELHHFLEIKSKLDYLDLNGQDFIIIHTIFSDPQVFTHGNKSQSRKDPMILMSFFVTNTCLSNLLKVQCMSWLVPSPHFSVGPVCLGFCCLSERRIHHLNALPKKAREDAEQGLGQVYVHNLEFFIEWNSDKYVSWKWIWLQFNFCVRSLN